MANLVIEKIIAIQIACAYVIYVNEHASNFDENILTLEEYTELYKKNLEYNHDDIIRLSEIIIKNKQQQLKEKKKNKKRGNK